MERQLPMTMDPGDLQSKAFAANTAVREQRRSEENMEDGRIPADRDEGYFTGGALSGRAEGILSGETDGKTDGKPRGKIGRGLSGSDLKIIAIVAMFIDHFAATLIYEALISGAFRTEAAWNAAYYTYDILRLLIGRIAFPIFCFLLVQGFVHTRNRLRYALRLLLFAFVSEIPFDLAFNQPTNGVYNQFTAFGLQFLEFGYQNVFFTLFLGLAVMILTDFIWKHPVTMPKSLIGKSRPMTVWTTAVLILKVLLAAIVLGTGIWAGNFLQTDYSGYGVLVIAVLYYLNRWQNAQISVGTFTLIFGDLIFYGDLSELLAPIGLILTKFYNGERGISMKYFFYAFYPAHLLLLVGLRAILFP